MRFPIIRSCLFSAILAFLLGQHLGSTTSTTSLPNPSTSPYHARVLSRRFIPERSDQTSARQTSPRSSDHARLANFNPSATIFRPFLDEIHVLSERIRPLRTRWMALQHTAVSIRPRFHKYLNGHQRTLLAQVHSEMGELLAHHSVLIEERASAVDRMLSAMHAFRPRHVGADLQHQLQAMSDHAVDWLRQDRRGHETMAVEYRQGISGWR